MKHLLILISFLLLTSCSMFERRDYSEIMDEYGMSDEPLFRANRDFMVISGDEGRDYRTSSEIRKRTPASEKEYLDDLHNRSLARELRVYEQRLSDDEYHKFDSIREQIGSTSQQIYYLSLSRRERMNYLSLRRITPSRRFTVQDFNRSTYGSSKSLNSTSNNYRGIASYAPPHDVALGMSMEQVVGNWGRPDQRDIAGNPSNKNERWAFHRNGKTKFVYFEQGHVQGWSEQ